MGKLFCWGRNDWGTIGDSTFAGLPCEGAIPCRPDAQPIAILGTVDMIASSGLFALARKSDGTVWSWGANPDARLGHMPSTGGDAAMCATGTTICNPKPTQLMGLP
jgi:alpha-tubulin suppressor-like RCC1 family protein